MGYAEGYSTGAQPYLEGTKEGIRQGSMMMDVGDRIADAIEKTRATMLRREREKDVERRAPQIEEQLKEIRQPYLLKQAEIQAAFKQMRLDPDVMSKEKLGLLIEEGLMARVQMNDATLQLTMGTQADANPLFAERFRPHAAQAWKAWENDAQVFENMSKALAEEEYNDEMLKIEERKAGAAELGAKASMVSAQAQRTEAAKDTSMDPAKRLDSWLDALETATGDFDAMPADDQTALLNRARAKTGNEELTLSDVRRSFVKKVARGFMREGGFPGFEEPARGELPEAPARQPEPEEPKSGARRMGEEFGRGLRDIPPIRLPREFFKDVGKFAEFIYGAGAGVLSGDEE